MRVPWWGWAAGAMAGVLLAGGGAAAGVGGPGGPKRPMGSPPLLKLGSSGKWVAFLRGILKLGAGTTFDAETDAAVRKVQASRGLEADGIVGPQTWAAFGIAAVPKPAGAQGSAPKPTAAFTPAAGAAAMVTGELATGLAEREGQILSAVAGGRAEIEWAQVQSSAAGHTAVFLVTRRAVAVDVGGKVIPSMSFAGAQKLADLVGAHLLTSRIADLAWKQAAVRLAPLTRDWNTKDGSGSKTGRMLEQSAAIESAVGGRSGIVANEGKDWVITRRFWPGAANSGSEAPNGVSGSRHNAANFGWYGIGSSRSPGGELVVQSIGLAHERSFVDYSQLVRLVQSTVIVDGFPRTIESLASDTELWQLVSDEGPLPKMRHPDL